MDDFKVGVGDKVVCVDTNHTYLEKGKVYTVSKTVGSYNDPSFLSLEEVTGGWYKSRFKLHQEEKELDGFKIGDKIVKQNGKPFGDGELVNTIVDIRPILHEEADRVWVHNGWLPTSGIKHYKKEEKTMSKYVEEVTTKKIKNVKDGYGPDGVLISVNQYGVDNIELIIGATYSSKCCSGLTKRGLKQLIGDLTEIHDALED